MESMVCIKIFVFQLSITTIRVQVAGCAVSFGLVAIWCMHFVGNRAIVLGDGEDAIQLYYSELIVRSFFFLGHRG